MTGAASGRDGLEIGHDYATPVDNTHAPPFKFTSDLKRMTVEL